MPVSPTVARQATELYPGPTLLSTMICRCHSSRHLSLDAEVNDCCQRPRDVRETLDDTSQLPSLSPQCCCCLQASTAKSCMHETPRCIAGSFSSDGTRYSIVGDQSMRPKALGWVGDHMLMGGCIVYQYRCFDLRGRDACPEETRSHHAHQSRTLACALT